MVKGVYGYAVNNFPTYAENKPFIVVRFVWDDNSNDMSVWFYGAYDNKQDANKCAEQVYNARVLPNKPDPIWG